MTEHEARAVEGDKEPKVGGLVYLREGATVVWPDQTERVVTGGQFILDQPGTFVVDGTEVTVK